jgi:hypothetical protein
MIVALDKCLKVFSRITHAKMPQDLLYLILPEHLLYLSWRKALMLQNRLMGQLMCKLSHEHKSFFWCMSLLLNQLPKVSLDLLIQLGDSSQTTDRDGAHVPAISPVMGKKPVMKPEWTNQKMLCHSSTNTSPSLIVSRERKRRFLLLI